MSLRSERTARIQRIAKKLARHWKKLRERGSFDKLSAGRVPLARRVRNSRPKRIIAYDFETTPIAEGTPRPLYLTACGADWRASVPISSYDHLLQVLKARFLTVENIRSRFVAWNGNGFDVYFIARALLKCEDFELRPYLTRGKSVRGLKVIVKPDRVADYVGAWREAKKKKPKTLTWEFLDGMAMTGVQGTLRDFVDRMAPDYRKLEGPDFEAGETFDPWNPEHVRYAERDSEGLYHAMMRAQSIVMENFGTPLQPTVGNMAIRIFQANMPQGVNCWEPSLKVSDIVRQYVMRGGYCYRARAFEGQIWKYDLNQAYAAAMRDARLPAGRIAHLRKYSHYFKAAIYRVKARHPRGTLVPFYYIDREGQSSVDRDYRGAPDRELTDTWITSIEFEQLRSEGWILNVIEGYGWEETFSMREYVDKLERLRTSAADGPSGALGTMVKSIGNNSYGKTVEVLDGLEFLFSLDKPRDFHPYHADEEQCEHVWFRFREPQWREYHQPQIGAFITAHVRMLVRRAALLAPREFLYADTDCVAFSRPVALPVDKLKYGFWKCEVSGEDYWIIDKKVYAAKNGAWDRKHPRHAKGMNVRRLTKSDFASWYAGRPPKQTQIQRNNFVAFVNGGQMFKNRVKMGARI